MICHNFKQILWLSFAWIWKIMASSRGKCLSLFLHLVGANWQLPKFKVTVHWYPCSCFPLEYTAYFQFLSYGGRYIMWLILIYMGLCSGMTPGGSPRIYFFVMDWSTMYKAMLFFPMLFIHQPLNTNFHIQFSQPLEKAAQISNPRPW